MPEQTLTATVENMRRLDHRRDVFAYDVATDERFSATPGDYFWMPANEPLCNADGEPLVLAVASTRIHPAVV